MNNYDVIIIGAGINGLTTASILGKKGKRVLVLESRDKIGGMASSIEFSPGFKCNLINDSIKWIDPRLVKLLDLEAYGLELVKPEILRIVFGKNGEHIAFHKNVDKTIDSISKYSIEDAGKWKDFISYIKKLSHFIEKVYALTPPKLPSVGIKEIFGMRSMLTPIRRHGTRGIVDLMRVAPMMMPELVDEWFENELLRSSISIAGIHHHSFGPYAAGTGYNLLHQHVHGDGLFHNVQFTKGGTDTFPSILKSCAESFNVEIKTYTKVISINTNQNECNGVTLENGEQIIAEQIVSSLDPNNTFMNLVGPSNLNPNFKTQLNNIRYRGSTARIHFALNKLPEITGITNEEMKTIFSISPSIKYLERASDSVKYGIIPDNPYVEFFIPSLLNPDFAPKGEHVLSATVQYAPYHLRNSEWSDTVKDQLNINVLNTLEKVIPNIRSIIKYTKIISPLDLENEFGLTEGNLNHGEMTLDQFMFMRPTISSAQYQTPINNLYLCGAGTHPGGGLHGTNGFNAAREILKG